MKKYINIKFITVLFIAVSLYSCKKFVAVPPSVTAITRDNVFSTDATAIAAATALYSDLSGGNAGFYSGIFGQVASVSLYLGIAADELVYAYTDVNQIAYYKNNLIAGTTGTPDYFWGKSYNQIYNCNAILEGLSKPSALTPSVKTRLTGEAKFMRAFYYFYLVNLYGDVPLTITTDVEVNQKLSRAGKAAVYGQIIADLQAAKQSLTQTYLNGDLLTEATDRVRPNYWAATALLARAYLYINDYAKAEAQSTEIINNTSLFDVSGLSLNNAFLKNSEETIWALQPTGTQTTQNTGEGRLFVLLSSLKSLSPSGVRYGVYLNNLLYNSFEDGDGRKVNWVGTAFGYNYSKKYKVGDQNVATAEHPIILRTAEQYLIRAEARANLNNIDGAASDINIIRTRARAAATVAVPDPLPDILPSINKAAMLAVVAHERQVELFTEWGHRWFDMKRTGTIDAVMTAVATTKSSTWAAYKALLPIPQTEIDRNPALKGQQNTGY